MSESDEPSLTYDIDWPMLDKTRYIPLNILSTFTVRSFLYPIVLVRTRLQVQIQSSIYKGTWHALTTTVRYEGFRALYKGFLVYNCQLIPGLIYVTTFETTRSYANIFTRNEYLRAGFAGSIASLIAQIVGCPIDVISQNMQLVGLASPDGKLKSRQIRRIHVPNEIRWSNYLIFKHICKTLLYENISDKNIKPSFSLKGFYRGYFISTFLFSLTSAIWWPSYYFYQKQMLKIQAMFRKSLGFFFRRDLIEFFLFS
jgi:solute carrier family 25 protein 44